MQLLIKFLLILFCVASLSGAFAFFLLNSKNNFSVKWFVVQSGSMEPSIMTGDIIFVASNDNYKIGDVVTFTDAEERTVTHRITEIISFNVYSTKGDANRAQDFSQVKKTQIIGKVVFVLPKLGNFVNFSKSFYGIVFLVFIPSAFVIFDSLLKLKNGKK